MPALQIDYRPIESLTAYARNARTHSDEQVAQIAASIREFGFNNPVLVDGQRGVIAGHARILAARKLAMTEVPVIELAHLTDTQRRAFILAENKLAEHAGWDDELLALELEELQLAEFDLALTGFGAAEIEALLTDDQAATDGEHGEGDHPDSADDVPEVPANPISRTGDVWALGQHRLICGDAADASVVSALMGEERAQLLVTSPPYANQRAYTTGGIADWDRLMQGVFAAAMSVMAAAAQMLVNLGLVHRDGTVLRYWDDWLTWMPRQGWRFFGWYVWDQGVTVPGDWAGRLAPRHEFLFHFNREARKPNKTVPCKFAGEKLHLRSDGTADNGLRNQDGGFGKWTHFNQPTQAFRIPDSVVTCTRQRGSIGEGIDHPAVFPVALPQFVIEAYTEPGAIVFDPFGGSGTTMLAAQRTGRVARSVEIAPEYVDVAVKRFQQNYPGVPVTLVATGQTFAEVADERLEGGE
ncbi:site-specific DNA-methyltransferase [Accumulibacter sp.]|uniref:site-specific DNA-methyltransferase n=1 Tax=Accumulibacter sp. TaxID=2053492 RepID=UPI0035AE77B4